MKVFITLAALVISSIANTAQAENIQKALFAGGCFWCVESDFESVKGVTEAVSGFAGGKNANPTYKTIGTHLEVVEITYDADVVDYATLVSKFFRSVDPVDAGGQFCDRGKSYTTAIFALDKSQKAIAKAEIKRINASGKLPSKVVTKIRNEAVFYPAKAFHQNYYTQTEKVLTRFGLVSKAKAYKKYRKGCGRDARVKQLWGDEIAFDHGT